MTKQQIISELHAHHNAFTVYLDTLTDAELEYAPIDKWSAAQQLDHLVRSVGPLPMAFSLPKLIHRLLFGKANRPSRTFDAQVAHYQGKLAQGGKASGKFVPKEVKASQCGTLSEKLLAQVESLCPSLNSFTEEELDSLLLPHPLLGKLTLREMLYFTIYHVQHHHHSIQKQLRTA